MAFFGNLISSLGARFGLGQSQPIFPKIEIGEGFYPQATVIANDLGRLAASFHSFHEPLEDCIRTIVIPSIELNFELEGRPPWTPLEDSTVKSRGAAHPILDRTGTLKDAATSLGSWRITDDTASPDYLEARVSYAGYNQGGTRDMVDRPFMTLQEHDVDGIERAFGRWVDKQIKTVGRF